MARARAAAAFASGGGFAAGAIALSSPGGAVGLRAGCGPFSLIFLRALVESNPVMPAPAAGAQVFTGGPSCVCWACVNFSKRGGWRGLVCKAGDSGSGASNGGGVCANTSALHNAREVAMSKRAPRGATEVC